MRVGYVKDANGDEQPSERDYTLITRIKRCRQNLDDLEMLVESKELPDSKRSNVKTGVINVERKLREIFTEIGGDAADFGDDSNLFSE